ncbi:hypothetical protein L6654_19775 [Bradyrhizobium sp. WYCCWR 13023]|uniref:Uncharacterized protein n=1 Tax=Bradyrhizobium zhengyangense TaxID=2911009 RepID=A0A9X1RCJ7_9BRAD|nr:hypothetical protein [Bradyrhizobium zhengyangense]MCG2628878.1 hypothetical protein [Bradyrhizobium zhengyangense]
MVRLEAGQVQIPEGFNGVVTAFCQGSGARLAIRRQSRLGLREIYLQLLDAGKVVGILWRRAKTFVVIGWIFFVVSVPVYLGIAALAGFNKFYFPAHPQATLDAYDIRASYVTLAVGALAAVTSSIVLALKFRATASLLVIVTWPTIIAGNQVARSFVKPGPDYYERHVGAETFLVPWKYVDVGFGGSPLEVSSEDGFIAYLCFSNLHGRTDPDCSLFQQLRVLSKEPVDADLGLKAWREHRSQMRPGSDYDGYQSFDQSYRVQADRPGQIQHYFVRMNSNGELTRLVECRLDNGKFCTHSAHVGSRWFEYQGDLADGDETLDARLAALVESWRRK